MNYLLSIGFAIIVGLLITRIIKPLHLPDVTAYLVTGVIIGPFLLGKLGIPGIGFNTSTDVSNLGPISNVALGFIAFAIGNEFRIEDLKKTGKAATVIGIIQALTAAILTDIALLILHFIYPDKLSIPVAITIGAIATATAPASTLMVVRQYKAKGELTNLLLPIVALDDAVGLIVFAISFGVAQAINSNAFDFISVFINPILEIIFSLLLGFILGALLTYLERLFLSNSNRLSLTIGFVILTVALASLIIPIGPVTISFSSLLVCMMLGSTFCNLSPLAEDLMERADRWTAPLFALFFIISGAGLELSVFKDLIIVFIGIVYVFVRAIGKYIGSYGSCILMHEDKKVTNNLGICLFPQAGVALGMTVTAQSLGQAEGNTIRNIVLFGILIYELIGPLLTKQALTRSGDITAKPASILNRRKNFLSGKTKSWDKNQ